MKRSAGRPPPQQMRASGALGMMQPSLHAAGVQNATAILLFFWKVFFYVLLSNKLGTNQIVDPGACLLDFFFLLKKILLLSCQLCDLMAETV